MAEEKKIHGIETETSSEAENSKYKCAYIDNNFCCHKLIYIIPSFWALTNFHMFS